MSALAPAVRVVWWWSFLTEVPRSISLLKKMRPVGITLATKDSLRIRDNSSLFVAFFLVVFYCRNSDVSGSNLSWGKCSSIFTVSRRMPRKVIRVVGPSIFLLLERPTVCICVAFSVAVSHTRQVSPLSENYQGIE